MHKLCAAMAAMSRLFMCNWLPGIDHFTFYFGSDLFFVSELISKCDFWSD
jgi:hypothetical protein